MQQYIFQQPSILLYQYVPVWIVPGNQIDPQNQVCCYNNSENIQLLNPNLQYTLLQNPQPQNVINKQCVDGYQCIQQYSEIGNPSKQIDIDQFQFIKNDQEIFTNINLKNIKEILAQSLIISENYEEFQLILDKIQNIELKKIIQDMYKKQQTQFKSKEELIKFCVRKSFRFAFKIIQNENNKHCLNLQSAQKYFLKKYFKNKNIQIGLPFKKNSKIKTMNQQFLSQIFKSSEFIQVYQQFLNEFEQIILKNNNEKIIKLSEKIYTYLCLKPQKQFQLQQIPWSQANIERLLCIARNILRDYGQLNS